MGMVFGPPRSVVPPGLGLDGLRSQRCRAGLSWFVPSGLDFLVCSLGFDFLVCSLGFDFLVRPSGLDFLVCPLGLDFDAGWLSCFARPIDGMHTISSTEHRAFISGARRPRSGYAALTGSSPRCRAGLSWFVPSGLDFLVCPLGLDFDA